MIRPGQARAIARQLPGDLLPRRWARTQGAAATAAATGPAVTNDPDLLIAAAWLHGTGYAPALCSAGTGFRPLRCPVPA